MPNGARATLDHTRTTVLQRVGAPGASPEQGTCPKGTATEEVAIMP